jgi:hypothetical protein
MKLKLNLVLSHERYDSDDQYLFNYGNVGKDIEKENEEDIEKDIDYFISNQPKIKEYYSSENDILLPLINL